ncbi:Asp-tRNA(Asn)/Glu-tRNA(Gln) amidotransferase subunit GatA [Candidatus Saccharibacteria bacterium]|nr:MAG: Asp-tRNA(Asn)/Glu-tRNA(Gln) amidotransferase subunit GatA [Candidatus Saccharibacteria bacterium]
MSQWKPIADIVADVRSGKTTASELVEQSLAAIEEKESFKAIIVTTADRARERAKAIDAGDNKGRLAGVPFIAKDNFLVFGADTTAASNILKGFDAPYQSTAIERLEAEGAICVAKANLDAFAHGSSTENSDFFTTKNPRDETRVPGGSSGGSAAAVVLGLAPFALGTDTGGSIRLPASFTGCVGLKPTYGLVSRSGVVAMASSTDCIGPLTSSVEDAALVLDVIAGKDALDSTTIDRDPSGYQLTLSRHPEQNEGSVPSSEKILRFAQNDKPVKIGVIKEYFGEGLSNEVRESIDAAIEKLKAAGADVQEVSLPSLPLALAVYYVLCPAEVSSNLSRFDGQRYGHNTPDAANLDESYTKTRETGFGKEAKRRVMIGTYVLSSGYYDAYYKKAQTVRTKLINEFTEVFKEVDVLVGPVAPTTAFKIGQNADDPLQMYLIDIMTVAANLVGVPSISVPAGMGEGDLPIGLQIMAPQRADRALLEVAKQTEEILA